MNAINYPLIDNMKAKQYELHIDGLIPSIEYIKAQNQIYLTHTELPVEFGGKGIGSAMVGQVLEDIEQKELSLVPACPFVAAYIKQQPEGKISINRNKY